MSNTSTDVLTLKLLAAILETLDYERPVNGVLILEAREKAKWMDECDSIINSSPATTAAIAALKGTAK